MKGNSYQFRCGTLEYTKAGLFTLFAYLLWGDFCFSLMEEIWPRILPLVLKAEGTSNILISLVITTIPATINIVMNPIVGTLSDRYRGRRGRRIPILLYASPFVAFLLLVLGFSRELAPFIHGLLAGFFPNLSSAEVVIGLTCLLIISFRFFEMIVNTIFWYLFNDVVPAPFIGRFLGMFRVVGSLAGALFNFYLFKYAESHTSLIFIGVAALYGVGFVMMCLNVKEGEYPPPTPVSSGRFTLAPHAKAFFSQCFSQPLFTRVYLYSMAIGFAGAANAFVIFMERSIGLTFDQIGKITGAALFFAMLLMYPMGWLVDRFHPLRVLIVSLIGATIVIAFKVIFLFWEFPNEKLFWIYIIITLASVPASVATASAVLPMLMRLFPHERFGQFCAANAICASFGMIAGGFIIGPLLDLIKSRFGDGDYFYRFIPIWSVLFLLIALCAIIAVYREWKRLGGDADFAPPIDDKFTEFHSHRG